MEKVIIQCCPFRIASETFPAMLIGSGDITRTSFEACLKEACPAFYVERGREGKECERCKRLM